MLLILEKINGCTKDSAVSLNVDLVLLHKYAKMLRETDVYICHKKRVLQLRLQQDWGLLTPLKGCSIEKWTTSLGLVRRIQLPASSRLEEDIYLAAMEVWELGQGQFRARLHMEMI